MQNVTTVLDVIEDATGRDLTPENLDFYRKLSSDELGALGDEIEEGYSEAAYAALPRPEDDEQVFAFSTFANASQVKFDADEMRGDALQRRAELYSALIYLPRVAVPIEIERLSKRWPSQRVFAEFAIEQGKVPLYNKRFLEELTFFAHIRDLVRHNQVVLIPQRYRLQGEGFPVPDAAVRALQKNPAFHGGTVLPSGRFAPDSSTAAILITSEVLDLLSFCSEHGYDPAFDINLYGAAFRAVRQDGTHRKRSGGRKVETNVKLPKLGSIDVETFVVARQAEAFQEFRENIDSIRKAASGQASDLDILDFAEETLTRGRERIDKELKTTTLRKVLFQGVRDFSIGLASNFMAGEVNPAWAHDPWKAVVSKSIETAVKQAISVPSFRKKKQGLSDVRRLYSIMLDDL